MTHKSSPRRGSLAFYPRKRAKRELATFKTVPGLAVEQAKPLNFLGYKAGMTHVLGKDIHERGKTFGQDIVVPCTIVECPPLVVFGVRAYAKKQTALQPLGDVFAQKTEKELLKRIKRFRKKSRKEKKQGTGEEEKQKEKTIKDFEEKISEMEEFRLLAHSQPKLTGIGKKKPEVFEIRLSGSREKQLAFAQEKLGKQLSAKDCFEEKQFVDVKAVTTGKGFQGVVKRFGVKIHRPKSKKQRVVGSIGPWNPSTVMWTVPRPGQHGYQTRTEYNRRIMIMGENGTEITPSHGFKNYGVVKNAFLLLSGSVPGPAKRAVALRPSIRKTPENRFKLEGIDFISTKMQSQAGATEEAVKAQKTEKAKEEKKERKSVAEEIAEAATKGK